MTEHLRVVPTPPRRPKRASRAALRTWAWVLGGVSFLMPTAVLAAAPRPAASANPVPSPSKRRPDVIIHHVIRKVVVRSAPRVVTVPSHTSGPVIVSGGGSAPAAGSTGGSHP